MVCGRLWLVDGSHVTALAAESVGCGRRGSVRGQNELVALEGEEAASLTRKHPSLCVCVRMCAVKISDK